MELISEYAHKIKIDHTIDLINSGEATKEEVRMALDFLKNSQINFFRCTPKMLEEFIKVAIDGEKVVTSKKRVKSKEDK